MNQLRALATYIVIFSSLFGCDVRKSNQNVEPEKTDIVSLINQGKADEALEKIEERLAVEPSNSELVYWKAQAYSLKAGIDIYSLFPLMKMELFNVAMSEWSKMNDFERRQRQTRNTTIYGATSSDQSAFNELEELEKELQAKPAGDFLYEVNLTYRYCSQYRTSHDGSTYVDIQSCSGQAEVTSSDFINGDGFSFYVYEQFEVDQCDDECVIERFLAIAKNQVNHEDVKNHALKGVLKKRERMENRQESENYFKAGFALFDSVPIMREIPSLSANSSRFMNLATDELMKIYEGAQFQADLRLKNNTKKQLGLIAALGVVDVLKKSIDLDKVEEPHDLACLVDPVMMISRYPDLLRSADLLLKVGKGTELEEKNAENFKKLFEAFEEAPEALTDEQKDNYIDVVRDYQKNNC